jgi:hypothetical protein
MTDSEKVAVSRLLLAIEASRKPLPRGKIKLPPVLGEWEAWTALCDAERARRDEALETAITTVSTLLAVQTPSQP